MHKIFTALYHRIAKHRLVYLAAALLVLAACCWAVTKIRFEEDISQIIPKSGKADITAKVLRQQNFSDKIVVIITKSKPSDGYELSETADAFLNAVKPLQKLYIKSIQGRVGDEEMAQTFDFLHANLPLFLSEKDYQLIAKKTSPDSIARQVSENYDAMLSPSSLVMKDFIRKDPLGLTFIAMKKLQSLNISKDFKLEDQYVVSRDGGSLLLFLVPKFGGSETKHNELFADALERIKTDLNHKFRGKTEISYFGSPLIAVANAKQIKGDIQKTVLISMSILFALLIFYFRNFFTPVIIFIPTAVSAIMALGVMYLIRDKISAISLSIGAILLGITIDYALHILTHYKHKANIEEVYREITAPILMSAGTTAVSFLCLVFVKSEALKDLGIFAAITVMLSAVFSLIIIPHIYSPKSLDGQPAKSTIVDKIGAYPYERNRWLAVFCSAIIVLSFFGFSKIKFNNNLGDLNFVPDEMKRSEAQLERLSDLASKSVYAIAYGRTQAEALEHNAELAATLAREKKQGSILGYQSIGELVLPETKQKERIEQWKRFWNSRKSLVLKNLKQSGNHFGFNESVFADFDQMLSRDYHTLSINDYKKLPALQVSEFVTEKDGLYTISNIVKLDEGRRDALISTLSKEKNILAIDRQQMNENFLGLLKDDFNSLVNYSLIAVIIIFMIFFRNIDLTVFAVIPIVLSGIVTAGILYFLGLELNIFSTIVCTLIFGAGVDFNIFLTQAMQKELTTGKSELPTYRVSIILALLTTVLAIGALVFAKHPALYSVSVVALVGMLAVVIISFALYPLLFDFVMKRSQKGLAPVSIRTFLNSVISLLYYALGGFIFSLMGSFMKHSKGKTLDNFKKAIARFLKSVLYSNPFVKKRVIANPNEDFSQPAVIIANHNSFLDTLALGMATHKIVYLVNDWVYNSKVFGKVVKALGYFPVSQGIENGIDPLKEKINQGYSLMVFPEAERSMDNKIKRFHKGAFYLAEKYGLDILPIYIHGNAEVMPKNDFMIHDGSITVKVGNRIPKNDLSFGADYSQRTKKINKYFRDEYQKLRNDIEDEDYFKTALFESFLFKENEVVAVIRKDFNENKSAYHQLNRLIGEDEKIFHWCGDFGQLDILLKLHEPHRKIISYIEDEDRRAIARQNFVAKRRNICYPDQPGCPEDYKCLLLSSDGYPSNLDFSNFDKVIVFNKEINPKIANFRAEFQLPKIKVFKRSL